MAKDIFDQALDISLAERGAFVDIKCGNDTALLAEVEKLLSAYDSDFLEDNFLGTVEALTEPHLPFGQVIGRYRIKEQIGTGGMGQVFLADDTELNRPVAFKVLHGGIAEDTERVRRFIQEARAASALNHPNILIIHEIGSFEGSRFIVSEYVDGDTLRDRMRSGLTVVDSVEITCQIAAALQAAHAAGIVHRDIKPENVMIRNDGLVKVLDFGLAKLTEADDQPIDPSAPPSIVHTSPGLVMGTVAYMSPEQARGHAVDARTDLWSLGVVLHEMLTGKSPFEGESMTELVSSILSTDCTPANIESLPPELTPICQKALTKDKQKRYQSAHDLLEDLKGEKKRMEYAIQPTPFISASGTDELKTQLIRRRPTLSAEYIVSSVRRHKYATLATIGLIVASAISLSVYRYNGATPPSSQASFSVIDSSTDERDLKFQKLPISDQARDSIAISPDGKYVAYLVAKSIRLLDVATSVEKDISPDGGWDIRFSPDSKFLYYVFGGYPYVIKRVSIQGGTPEKVTDDTDNGPSFSPDGSTMVFAREIPRETGGEYKGKAIVIANPDGSNERNIATIENRFWITPAFSPDGKMVASIVGFQDENGQYAKLVGFNVANGKQHVISEKKWNSISGVVWLPNGNLVLTAREKFSDPSQLWSIPPVGEPRAITSGLMSYHGLSGTRNGDALVTRQGTGTNSDSSDLWIVPGNDASKTKRLTTSGEMQGRFAWTPDGRIVFGSDVSGNRDLWIMNADATGRMQLTRDPGGDVQPAVSSDGKHIAFTSNRTGGVDQIFYMTIDGQNVKQLTQGQQKILPCFSPDGKWVYFVELPTKTVKKVSINGGEPTLVATAPKDWNLAGIDVNRADGRLLYGLQQLKDDVWSYKLGIVPIKGEARVIDVSREFNWNRPRWTPDNRSVAVFSKTTESAPEIWTIPVDGKGKPRKLTDFKTFPGSGGIGFSWTVDGKQLLVGRSTFTMNPVLIRNSGN